MLGLLNRPAELLAGQLVTGLFSGSFCTLMSLALIVVFGRLTSADFFHGVQFMLGAFVCALRGSIALALEGCGKAAMRENHAGVKQAFEYAGASDEPSAHRRPPMGCLLRGGCAC